MQRKRKLRDIRKKETKRCLFFLLKLKIHFRFTEKIFMEANNLRKEHNMANVCVTGILIKGGKDEIKKFQSKLKEAYNKDHQVYGIASYLGIEGLDEFNFKRGEVYSLDLDKDEEVYVGVDTVRSPSLEIWKAICDKYLSSEYSLIYSSEECGAGIAITNDESALEKINLEFYDDICNPNDNTEIVHEAGNYFLDYDEAVEILEKATGFTCPAGESGESLNDLLRMADNLNIPVSLIDWERTSLDEAIEYYN